MSGNPILDLPYTPAAAITRFQLVKLSAANTVTPCTALGELAWGVAQESVSTADVTNGRVVNVRLMGRARVIAGAALGAGVPVRTDATGKVVALAATTANQKCVGFTECTSGASGDHIDIILTFAGEAST